MATERIEKALLVALGGVVAGTLTGVGFLIGRWMGRRPATLISLPRQEFERVKQNPRFVRIVQLARIVNTLRYTHMAGVRSCLDDDTSGPRQRIASSLYVAGLLYEGFRVVDVLGKDFKTSRAFTSGFALLLKEREIVQLRQGVLNDLRNKAVFHSDEDAVRAGLDRIDAEPVVFARSRSGTSGSAHYELADLAVLEYTFGGLAATDLDRERERITRLIFEVALKFEECADKLIVEVLRDTGWKGEGERSA